MKLDRNTDRGGRGKYALVNMRKLIPLLDKLEEEKIDGNYEPGNVRWVTQLIQQNNKRTNRRLTFDGRTQSIARWAAELSVHRNLILRRLDKGWTVRRALTEPSRATRPTRMR